MEPSATPVPETTDKSAVELFGSIMGKVGLGFLFVVIVLALINSRHDPAMNYTGGGTVTMSVPFGSTSCMVTVKQDNGVEHAYDKIVAPYCTGFSAGNRVHITRGMVD